MLIQAAIFRSREFAADRGAVAIAGTPYGLIGALTKIDAVQRVIPLDANPAMAHMFISMPLSGRGLLSLFSTHPPTEQRIRALLGNNLCGDRVSGCAAERPKTGGTPTEGKSTHQVPRHAARSEAR